MKLKFFTLLLLSAACFASCRKITSDPDIKQYDQQQIESYIAANGLTGMQRDKTNGDTTGTYYQILSKGDTTKAVDYPSYVSFVYTIRSFDGKYILSDTITNHYYGVLGHVVPPLPTGLIFAIRNNLKYLGGKMRVLVPSHLAFGKTGYGSGSITLTSGRIAGNQCLDVTVNLIENQGKYDQMIIKNYMAANNLTGYTMTSDSLWYKIIAPGTNNPITDNSSLSLNYKLYLMDNTNPDGNIYTSTTVPITDISSGGTVDGFVEGLRLLGKGGGGGQISIIVPSKLAYGPAGSGTIVANSCLRWDISNVSVTN
ncbi:MAG TPA: FKBP-type peptidyl-prolyl cis-trans isomerase [Mucilaginibacter sp.]|jgi:FKBP-type peptidyl-prolyl cis-trans isomerase|nr:FKBP-type peptidyl-prolyl cis-trans isomerase [Mucilaginibacter sp.]